MRRHIVTKNSFYARLADHGHEIVSDEDYAHLYSERKGRPSIPPSVMVRAMLCATHDRITSDAETSRRTRVDADWKAAMGVDDDFEASAPGPSNGLGDRACVGLRTPEPHKRLIDRPYERRTSSLCTVGIICAGAMADLPAGRRAYRHVI